MQFRESISMKGGNKAVEIECYKTWKILTDVLNDNGITGSVNEKKLSKRNDGNRQNYVLANLIMQMSSARKKGFNEFVCVRSDPNELETLNKIFKNNRNLIPKDMDLTLNLEPQQSENGKFNQIKKYTISGKGESLDEQQVMRFYNRLCEGTSSDFHKTVRTAKREVLYPDSGNQGHDFSRTLGVLHKNCMTAWRKAENRLNEIANNIARAFKATRKRGDKTEVSQKKRFD